MVPVAPPGESDPGDAMKSAAPLTGHFSSPDTNRKVSCSPIERPGTRSPQTPQHPRPTEPRPKEIIEVSSDSDVSSTNLNTTPTLKEPSSVVTPAPSTASTPSHKATAAATSTTAPINVCPKCMRQRSSYLNVQGDPSFKTFPTRPDIPDSMCYHCRNEIHMAPYRQRQATREAKGASPMKDRDAVVSTF